MEQMKETLEQFDKRFKKERAIEKYNDRMKERLLKSFKKHNTRNVCKRYTPKPQSRKTNTKINKGEEFVKLTNAEKKDV